MSRRIAVSALQVPEVGERILLVDEDLSIALFNVDGQLYAIDDCCPHQGASLCSGRLEGQVIKCCAHGLRFDLASGYLLNSTRMRVASYPVEVIDGEMFIVIVSEECIP
ncbi:Rieske 2Fe-2S domain-containing protein [Pseudomonas sp. YuFO20]|uniref:Rieske (2Fe-2S) protein n=1 Tax=Pseudomonas sp. YuFO20 TaxID=3095362 RepID=UPI002B2441D3|nr:Rieske 2Fe-2S domain-containing protein [Pseudomonas sp. YuFO20]MEB2519019.1 Rieske 2Fe-2S domain-containing protein [Pseudomonas sp. YuFO20]